MAALPLLNRRHFLMGAAASILASPSLHMLPSSVVLADDDARGQGADTTGGKLIVHGSSPMNAEPQLGELVKSWVTPTELFYIRSHAPVPKINAQEFRLSIEGLVDKPISISLAELQDDFKQHSVTCTMTCAGNRRTEHSMIKPVKGVPWQAGAIGNAKWTGTRLSELLKKAGVQENAKHVWFEGLDQIERSSGVIPFGGSIPIEKAVNDSTTTPGALLTTRMNGQPLNGDHGAPLRMVVPGYIGARSVKWLGKIVVSDRPSPNHYVANAYKIVTEGSKLEWAEQGPIYRFAINSVICTPATRSNAKNGKLAVAGYALPSGGAGSKIQQVDVSTNNGKTWIRAKLTSAVREYCWALWSAQIPISASTSQLVVRATDSKGKTQPQRIDWNMKGYMFNSWHRTKVH